MKLPQTNYSLICIQEREERLAGSGHVDSDDGVDYNEPERKKPFTSEECFVYSYNVNSCTTFTNVQKQQILKVPTNKFSLLDWPKFLHYTKE